MQQVGFPRLPKAQRRWRHNRPSGTLTIRQEKPVYRARVLSEDRREGGNLSAMNQLERLRGAIQVERLIDTASQLIEVPSPTRSAGPAADRLSALLSQDGFEVSRPKAAWPESPAVVVKLDTGRPGRTIQFNGHLDTVHLPFVKPRIAEGLIYGSGAADMKGGVAAMCEALRMLKETEILKAGSVLLTTQDLHEAPWGDQRQLKAIIDEGYTGDGVLIPEYQADCLPLMGRGGAVLEVEVTRDGSPVHEVMGGIDKPSVIHAGAEVVRRFAELDRELEKKTHPLGARESIFVGEVHSGEIFNQAPTRCRLAGTRRWLPGTDVAQVEKQFQDLLRQVAARADLKVDGRFLFLCNAFELDGEDPLVQAFQSAAQSVMGKPLALGSKRFLDDGNRFVERAGIPAITHGPDAKGAHTVNEQVAIDELERVALVYALTAVLFCGNHNE